MRRVITIIIIIIIIKIHPGEKAVAAAVAKNTRLRSSTVIDAEVQLHHHHLPTRLKVLHIAVHTGKKRKDLKGQMVDQIKLELM